MLGKQCVELGFGLIFILAKLDLLSSNGSVLPAILLAEPDRRHACHLARPEWEE
jgi:hypothetical protein